MAKQKKYGSIFKVSTEFMTSMLPLPDGAKVIGAEFDFERDLICFKIHTPEPMGEYGRELQEGQTYPTCNFVVDKDKAEVFETWTGKRRTLSVDVQK